MTIKVTIIAAALTSTLLSGCAPMVSGTQNISTSPELVRAETAKHFGVSTRSVRVQNYNKGLLATQYQARVSGKLYNCQYYYASVTCKRPGTG